MMVAHASSVVGVTLLNVLRLAKVMYPFDAAGNGVSSAP